HAAWFGLMEEAMLKIGITNWNDALAENIAGAVTVRSLERDGQAPAADLMKKSMVNRGLTLLPYIASALAVYEKDRGTFGSLKSFAPKIMDAIDELEPVFGGGEPGDLGLADVWLTDEGVPVKAIAPTALAAKAGIKKGDTIQSIGGIRINGSESYL